MPITKGANQLIAEASRLMGALAWTRLAKFGDPDVVFVDIRDVRELEREGMIPVAFHATRGMLAWSTRPSPTKRHLRLRQFCEFVLPLPVGLALQPIVAATCTTWA